MRAEFGLPVTMTPKREEVVERSASAPPNPNHFIVITIMTVTTRSLGLMSLFLRGFDHEPALEAHYDIEHGDKLILLREPENRHDQNAV